MVPWHILDFLILTFLLASRKSLNYRYGLWLYCRFPGFSLRLLEDVHAWRCFVARLVFDFSVFSQCTGKLLFKTLLCKSGVCFTNNLWCFRSLFVDLSRIDDAVASHLDLNNKANRTSIQVTVRPYEEILDALKEIAKSGARVWVTMLYLTFIIHCFYNICNRQ